MNARLGQHFLADTNLLELIVREAQVDAADVVLEVGGGEGALSERLAPLCAHLHVVEVDRRMRDRLEPLASEAGNMTLHWGDAMRLDLGLFDPAPTRIVSNLPYSIATPLILRTIEELARVSEWLVMVQREIADRLTAGAGSEAYGAPSAVVQLACEVEFLRAVDPAVFSPRPRVGSALLRLVRRGPAPPAEVRELIRQGFAHRRKSLARSLELARGGRLEDVRNALVELGHSADIRAEALPPGELAALARHLQGTAP